MRPRVLMIAAAALLTTGIVVQVGAQAPAAPGGRAGGAAPGGQGAGGRGGGRATFPAQQRAPGDPALIAKGRALYEINCRSCHGADLRGGDIGGPNLLRSEVVLKDDIGELIEPIVRNGKSTPGVTLVMPPLPSLTSADVRAIAEYIHSVVATARGQGAPPPGPPVVLNILVGNAAAGQAYFAAKCSSCHSATGDLRGIASRIADPKTLQNTWVNGGGGGGRGGGAAGPAVTVTVTQPSGERVEGPLVSVDDFLVVLTTADGRRRSFARKGDTPRVDINDPRAAHTDLLSVYTDKDIHDVTAYLVTLK
ncbi:MAG: c-type cytochrome [Acidobacteria bacterium]|nr:c-type cytochrome [Acidobacteriota bacterium]